jgi:hypothetical protein
LVSKNESNKKGGRGRGKRGKRGRGERERESLERVNNNKQSQLLSNYYPITIQLLSN